MANSQDRSAEWLGRVLVLAVLLAAVLHSPAAAHGRWDGLAQMVFTHVARDRELPNAAFAMALAQDSDGFLWVGTENGLARWDGYRFRIYKHDANVPGSVPDNVIIALHADRAGHLWVGTDSAGMARYDPGRDAFIAQSLGPAGHRDAAVRDFSDDGVGGLWIASDGGLTHLDAVGRIRERIPTRALQRGSIPLDGARTVLRDRRGTLWVGTSGGLARRPAGSAHFTAVSLLGAQSAVFGVIEDEAGRIWVGTRGHGAYVVDPASATVRAIREPGAASLGIESQTVLAVALARRGEVWLGTDDGLLAVDTSTLRTRRMRHDADTDTSLPSDSVLALFRDHAGLLWVATTRSLSHCDPQQQSVLTVFGPTHQRGGLHAGNVRGLLAAPDGRVWAATGRRGVELLDPSGRRDSAVPLPTLTIDGVAVHPDVESLAASPAGDVYLGGYRGLFRSNPDGTAVQPIALPASVQVGGVRALAYFGARLWLAGPDGVWTLDHAQAKHVLGTRLRLQLTDDRITFLTPAPDGNLWIGTENGLNRYDPRAQRVERIRSDPTDPAGLSSNLISALLPDVRGRVWIGTQGGGIDVMDRDSNGRPRFRRLGLADGLPNDDINALIEDRRGNVWVSTDDGLSVIDPTTFAVHPLHAAEGLGIAGYWNNSVASTPAGELIFGGLGGLTVVRPERFGLAAGFLPPVVITEFRVGGKVVPADHVRADGSAPATLDVARGEKSFAVGFAALDYSAPERLRYAYRLEGFDDSWNETSADQRFAAYTNVPPGDYRLELRGSNRDGVWSAREAVLRIRVEPEWYQLPAVRAAGIAAVLALIALFVRGRTELLRRRQRELEREVAARTAALRAAQSELHRLAYVDALTALPNRRLFTESFAELISSAHELHRCASVILLDLDGFKTINDTLGHDAGDAVLIEAGARLRAAVRDSDTVFRLGGDEFAILLDDVGDRIEVERICRRVVDSFGPAMALRDAVTVVTSTSIGVALFPDDAQTPDELYKCADVALYAAKRSGRNTWRVYCDVRPATNA